MSTSPTRCARVNDDARSEKMTWCLRNGGNDVSHVGSGCDGKGGDACRRWRPRTASSRKERRPGRRRLRADRCTGRRNRGTSSPVRRRRRRRTGKSIRPSTHTRKNSIGLGRGPAISLAVRKMEEPMMPLTSSSTESSRVRPRIRVGLLSVGVSVGCVVAGSPIGRVSYPMPSSSGDSSGVPHWRQMMAPQSPQASGSGTSLAQSGQ